MFSTVRHIYRVAKTQVREHVVKHVVDQITGKRSGAWRATRKHFLEDNATCAACGGKSFLNVHHKEPFHLDPPLELDLKNLITLCMGKFECHLMLGHGDDFKAYNPLIEKHASLVLKDPSKRSAVEAEAKAGKKYT